MRSFSVIPRLVPACAITVIPRLVRGISTLCLLLALVACSEPQSVEQFLSAEEAEEGCYAFVVDLSDSTRIYDLSLYGRLDGDRSELAPLAELPLTVEWVSPTGERYGEMVRVPLEGKDPFSRSFSQPYRRGLRPREWGEWRLEVEPQESGEYVSGIGIILEHSDYGTR